LQVTIEVDPDVYPSSAPAVKLWTHTYDAIPAKKAITSTVAVHVPRNAFETGTYVVAVFALARDSFGDVYTAAMSTAGAPLITVLPPKTTLSETVAKSTLPASMAYDSRAIGSVTMTITNDGNYTTAGTTTVSLFATTTGFVDSTSTKLATVTRPLRIRVGQSTQLTLPVRKLRFLLPEKYTVIAHVTDQSTFIVVGPLTVN
jgi:hypothetical protein